MPTTPWRFLSSLSSTHVDSAGLLIRHRVAFRIIQCARYHRPGLFTWLCPSTTEKEGGDGERWCVEGKMGALGHLARELLLSLHHLIPVWFGVCVAEEEPARAF
ncbi:hypothetical protein BDV98DRAFT_575637, partial [Pterulicium gracile]